MNPSTKPAKIIVCLEGGVVTGVLCDTPVEVVSLDYDTEGALPQDTILIPQCTEPTLESEYEPAYLHRVNPETNVARVNQLFQLQARHA